MERLDTSDVSMSNGNIRYPIGKSIFAVNLSSKLFSLTTANADVGSLKSHLHTLLKNICITCRWNFNKIVWSKIHEILSFLTKNGLKKMIKRTAIQIMYAKCTS